MTFLDLACEDVWVANDKHEAQHLARLYEDELNGYHWRLLEEVIFGQEDASHA